MKKEYSILLKLASLTFLLLNIVAQSYAQKLPNIQQTSFRAPSNVKIDGKAEEWGPTFQAYNQATELFYTIANDSKRLYLIVKSGNQNVVNNIINGGVRINIQKGDKKSDNGSIGVKYPYFEKGKRVLFILRQRSKGAVENAEKETDSIRNALNKRLESNVKWIYTSGIFALDSVISVYNEHGIEAASAFDSKKVYTCELAVDLKLLRLSVTEGGSFNYHIIANAEPNKYLLSNSLGELTQGKNADGTPMSNSELEKAKSALKGAADIQNATTDFLGEYTLAK